MGLTKGVGYLIPLSLIPMNHGPGAHSIFGCRCDLLREGKSPAKWLHYIAESYLSQTGLAFYLFIFPAYPSLS